MYYYVYIRELYGDVALITSQVILNLPYTNNSDFIMYSVNLMNVLGNKL